MRHKKIREKFVIPAKAGIHSLDSRFRGNDRGKARIALITALAIITGLSLSFAISSLSSYTGDAQTIETLSYKSPLIWRIDGEGDYLLSELAPDGTYELVEAVETSSQIETLVATWEFKGKVILELSADNGQNYSTTVYGAPIAGFTSGNQIKWRVTLGPDSELSEIRVAYTDTEGAGGTFGAPALSGFGYRKSLNISNPSGEGLFNYQIEVEIEEEGIRTTADFQDIRFTATDGETVLAHYLERIEGTTPNRVATFYVKAPQIPATGLNLYIYYGNPEAEDISSPDEAFDFFDDFSSSVIPAEAGIQKWEIKYGTATVSNGQLRLEDAELLSKTYRIEDGIIEYRARADEGNEIRLILRSEEEGALPGVANQIAYSSVYEGAEHCIVVGDIVKANQAQAIVSGITYDYRVMLEATNLVFQRYTQDYTELQAEVIYDDTGGLTSGSIGLKAGTGCVNYFDQVRVRKYINPEPYISSTGSEESVSLARFSGTTLAENGNVIARSEAISTPTYTTAPVSTACDISVITPSLRVTDESDAISIDISADGGASWREDCTSGSSYSAPLDFSVGRELLLRANLSIADTTSISELKLDYSIAPMVTSENLYCSGATGEGGVYVSGDAIIVEWDNSATGDNNPDILSVSCNFEPFGGSEQTKMNDDNNEDIYTIIYKLPEGVNTTTNIFVTASNTCGIATRDGHILTVNTTDSPLLGAEEEEATPKKEKTKNLKKRYMIKFGKDEAEIGDFETEDFRPHVKVKRWGEECFLSIEFPDTEIPKAGKSVTSRAGKVEWDSPEVGSHFYKKERKEVIKEDAEGKERVFTINEDDGLEFELILKTIPVSNVFSFPIKSEGLSFYYQGPLTEEEIAQGALRPDEVVGSYAVYHESKKNDEYKTGKAFHIYRPKIIDANGDWVWAELNIDETTLTITIDRAWLNNAAYPVIIDPTIGYGSNGASSIILNGVIKGSVFTGVANRRADSISAYLQNADTSTHPAKYAIYLLSDLSLVDSTAVATIPVSSTDWYSANLSLAPDIAAVDYVLAGWADNDNILIYYDTGAAAQGHTQTLAYGTWPDPLVSTTDTNKYSIYTTYTEDVATFNITVTLDATLPTVSSVTPTSSTAGDAIDFTVTFQESMDTSVAPTVKFGVSDPYTTYTVTAKVDTGYTNGFQDAAPTIWEGTAAAGDTETSGSYHLSISGAKDAAGNTMATDTTETLTINQAAANYVTIRDTVSNGGSAVTTDTITTDDTLTVYAAAYDVYDNYIADQSVTWSVTGDFTDADLTSTTGASTTFDPDNTGTGTVTATHATATDDATGDITVNLGAASKLGYTQQPSATATAGLAFATQPIVAIQDADGNTITTDSTTQITLARSTGTDTLQGTVTATVSSGLATFSGLSYNTAETMNIAATHVPYDTTINFTTEGSYAQEDSTDGTDFASGVAKLQSGGNDSYTKLVIHSDTTNGSTTFTNSSASSHTITAYDNAQHSTTEYKFGATSMYFDGTGDYLGIPDSEDWNVGSGDFTVDLWIKRGAIGTQQMITGQIDSGGGTTSLSFGIYVLAGNTVRFQINDASSHTATSTGTITDTTTWHHLAGVRDGNTLKLFIDGTLDGTADVTGVTANNSTNILAIGRLGEYDLDYFNGYIDEARISKGIARWTANFTPPTVVYSSYPTSQSYYVTTAAASQVDTSAWTGMTEVNITETTPTDTSIKYLVSFDGRTTWKQWTGSAWTASSLANLQTEGMTKTAVEAITQAQWEAADGFVPATTTTLDFAADLATTDSSATPELDLISVNYTTASDYTSATSDNVVVSAATAVSLTVESITDPVTAGTASGVVVTAKDTYDNTALSYTGTVTFTSSDSGASTVLPDNYTFLSGDNGTKTFDGSTTGYIVTLTTKGEQTVTATDTVTGSINGTQSAITVNPAAILDYTVTPTSAENQTAGTGFSETVTAYDTYDNVVTTDSTTAVAMTETGSASFYPDNTYDTTAGTYTWTQTADTDFNGGTATDTTVSGTGDAGVVELTGGYPATVQDIDGNTYNTVVIGDQCWMKENLNVTKDPVGVAITRYCYGGNPSNCESGYGGIYLWSTAMNGSGIAGAQGICPNGWHIPTHNEWTTLERGVCTSGTCVTDFPYDTGTDGLWRGTDEGDKLKTAANCYGGVSCGTSGFEALLTGYRSYGGTFYGRDTYTYFWSSSTTGYPWWRGLNLGYAGVYRVTETGGCGLSVRCIRNSSSPYVYPTSGNLTSSAYDAGASASFNSISWSATTPTDTLVKFQVATNTDNTDWTFIGPDGTASTYYTVSGQALHSDHANDQYVKYKAYLESSDSSVTPTLSDVTVSDAPAITAYTLASGVATIYVKDITAEDITITATDLNEKTGTSSTITVDPAAANYVTIEDAASNGGIAVTTDTMTTDETLSLYAAAYDVYDNYIADQSVTWSVTGDFDDSDLTATSGASTTFSPDNTGTGTVTAVHAAATDDATGDITVSVGALNYVKIETAASGAGSEVTTHSMTTDDTLTVYAAGYDTEGNYIQDESVTWGKTGTLDETPVGPATSTEFSPSTSATSGTITATHASATDDATDTISVGVGAATKLGYTQQPSATATAGTAFATQPILAVQDAEGNTVTTDDTTQITLSRSTGTDTLQGTATLTVTDGLATFSGLYYNTAETMNIAATQTAADTTINFTTEASYTQEDAADGTDFDGGVAKLYNPFSIINGVWTIVDDDLATKGTGTGYLMWPRLLSCEATNFNGTKQWKTANNAGQPVWDDVAKSYTYPGAETAANYPAFGWAEGVEYKGYTDWRLPTRIDLLGACFTENLNWPAESGSAYYWSSTEDSAVTTTAYFVRQDNCWSNYGFAKANLYHVVAVRTGQPSYPTSQAYYITTAAASQVDTSTWTGMTEVNITETTPTDTSIKYLVSFDGRTTWKQWTGSAWTASSLANLQTEGMTKTEVEAITQAQWETSGGFVPATTTVLDFAADLLTTSSSATPELDLISVNYTTALDYTSATSNNIEVSAAAVDHYDITEPTTATAGADFEVTVTPHDANNNTTTGSATVTLSAETAQAVAGTGTLSSVLKPTLIIDTSGGAVTVTDLQYTKAEDIKIKATDGTKTSTFADITNTITVNPAAIYDYTVPGPTPQTAGTGWSETISALDTYDNTVTTDSSTVIAMTNTGSAKFYPDNTYDTTSGTYTWTQTLDADFNAGADSDVTVSGDSVILGEASEWVASSLDSVGTKYTSIALDSLGKVHMSYAGGNVLKYATNATGAWVYTAIDSGGVIKDTSIALDSSNKVYISYLDSTAHYAKYATNATGTWVTSTIEVTYTYDIGSIAIDSTNKAHVAYGTSNGVRYATNSTGSWTYEAVASGSVGNYFRYLALDSADKVHISYLDTGLKYATNATGAWITSILDSVGDVGRDNCIAIDSTDKAHISYYDRTNMSLKYATNTTGTWVTSTLDSAGTELSYIFNDSIAIDSNNKPHISYNHYGNTDLKYATNVTGAWVYTTIDSVGSVGYYNSIAIDSNNKPHISYADATNGSLKYAYQTTYQSSGNLTSSSYDAGASASFISISWSATTPTDTLVKFQVATNTDNLTWTFIGPDGTASTYYTVSGQALHSSHADDQYVKYKTYFETSDTSATPTLSDVTVSDAPEITAYTLTAGEAIIYVKDTTAETITITATDNNDKTGTSSSIVVDPATLSSITIRDAAANAGSAIDTYTMTADDTYTLYAAGYDEYGNYRTGDESVTWAVTGTLDATPTGPATSTIFAPSTAPTSGTITATSGAVTDATGTITVNVGILASITIEDAASSAGSAVGDYTMTTDDTYTLYAAGYDAEANYVADQSVTWAVTGTLDATPTGPATSTTFSPSTAPKSGTITADDGATHIDITGTITVNPGATTKLGFTTQPSATATAGTAFTTQPVIAVQDAEGNTVISDSSTQITLARSTGTDTLQGTTTATVSSGLATFSGLSYNTAETMNILAQQATADTTINFTTEASYTQEDAADGTDFDSGVTKLHPTLNPYTKLLIHSDTTDASVTFADSSTSVNVITPVGDAKHSILAQKFGATSMYFDGTGDYLSIPNSADWDFGSGDFTVDFWIKPATWKTEWSPFGWQVWGYMPFIPQVITGDGNLALWGSSTGSSWDLFGGDLVAILVLDNWQHLAFVRDGNNFKVYLDGSETYSEDITGISFMNSPGVMTIGESQVGADKGFNGYIDELRVSKGTARWTSNFTPPTSAYSGATTYPTAAYYVTTAAASQVDTSAWTGMTGVSITQTTPTDTSTKYLVSFDGRTTWKYWSGSAWTASLLANLQAEGMTKTEVEAITQAQWEASGGFVPATTITLDFAADLATTDNTVTPEIDLISVNYTTASDYTSATSNNVVVSAAGLNSFVVDAPPTAIAGTTFSTTITAKDVYNNTTTEVSLATALTVSAGTITPTSILAAEFTNDGIWTGNITLKAAVGEITITATNGAIVDTDIVSVSAAPDGTLVAGDLVEPAVISSLVDTEAEKLNVFDFKITDAAADELTLKLKQIVITQGANNTAVDWTAYIAGASITDGATIVAATVNAANLTFGDGTVAIFTLLEDAINAKTYTLSIWLESTLPAAGDGKIIEFDIDPNDDIAVDSSGSVFDAAAVSITSASKPVITVVATELRFVPGPSSTCTINNDIAQHPIIKATDANGNVDLDDTEILTITPVLASVNATAGSGTLSLTPASGSALIDGVYTNTVLQYDTVEAIDLKIVGATLGGPYYSDQIVFSAQGTSTVDAVTTPQANFALDPAKDIEANKFSALKFKVTDAGGDSVGTLIDQLTVSISGTGANASSDIVWAELYRDTATAGQVAEAVSITDTSIVFGATPNSGSDAGLDTVADSSSVEYTINIYMKPTVLTAIDNQAYIFGIGDSGIGTDSATSSQMGTSVSPVSDVTGTVTVSVSKLVVTGSSATMDAGSSIELTITAKDANNNIDLDYIGAKSLTFSGLSTIEGNVPVVETIGFDTAFSHTFASGVSTANGLTLIAYEAGSSSVDVTDATYSSSGVDDDLDLVINPLTAIKAGLSGPSEVIVAANSDAFTLTSKDTYGNASNVVLTSAFTLTSTTSGIATFLYAGGEVSQVTIVANSSSVNFNYKDTRVAASTTVTATCATGDMIGAATHALEVTPAALHHFTISGEPSTIVAGVAFTSTTNDITVTAYDVGDNLKTNYTGTIIFSSTDTGGSTALPANYVFLSGDAGAHTFSGTSFTLTTAGSKTITVADGAISRTTGAVTVTPADAVTLAVESITDPIVAGVASSVIVTAKDIYDNTDTNYIGTIAFTSSDTYPAVLPADYTFLTANNGTKTFPDGVALKTVGEQSVTVTDTTSSITGTQSDITVTPAGAASLVVTGISDSFVAGSASSVTVTAYDTYDNIATGYTGIVAFTSSDTGASTVLPDNYTFLSGDSGVKTFDGSTSGEIVTLTTSGEKTVTATDTVTSSITGTQSDITVTPISAVSLTVTGISDPFTAGTASGVTVTAYDTYDNIATGYTGIVAFTSSDDGASTVLPSNYTFLSSNSGVKAFDGVTAGYKVTLTTAGEKTVTATDTVTSSITGTQSAITVNPAATDAFTLTSPADILAGARAAYTVTRYDVYDNLRTAGADTIYLYSSSTGSNKAFKDAATDGSTIASLVIADNSSSTNFWYYDEKASVLPAALTAEFTITVSDSAGTADSTTGIDDASDTLKISPAARNKYKVTAGSLTMLAGGYVSITINSYDTYDNVNALFNDANVSVVFSGASIAPDGTTYPKCSYTSPTSTLINFGTATLLNFAIGEATSVMHLFAAETAHIKATQGTIITSASDDLDIIVTGGTATQLTFNTQNLPVTTAVKNAPWPAFTIDISDAYGNLTSEAVAVTIEPVGATALPLGGTATVTSSSGQSIFSNVTYPEATILLQVKATAVAAGLTEAAYTPVITVLDKYNVIWSLLDYVAGTGLSSVNVNIYDGANALVTDSVPVSSGDLVNSGFNIYLPYDSVGYDFEFSKTAYVSATESDKLFNSTSDGADGTYDGTVNASLIMMSVAESLADYNVLTDFVYDENGDVLYISARLERRGQQILTSGIRSLQTCTIKIYDSRYPTSAIYTNSLATADALGNYWFTITDAVDVGGFVSGRSYFAKIDVIYGVTNGTTTTYSAATTFDIGVAARLKTWTEEIQEEVSGVKTDLATQAGLTRTAVTTAVESIEDAVSTEADVTQEAIADEADVTQAAIATQAVATQVKVTAAKEVLRTKLQLESASRILNQQSTIRNNGTLVVRYKTSPSLIPVITVYDPSHNKRVSDKKMTETISGASGIYEYSVKFIWGLGEHTIICQEVGTGTLDGMNIEVIATDLEDISTSLTTATATLAGIDTDELGMMSSKIAEINSFVSRMISSVDELSQLRTKTEGLASDASAAIYDQLELASQKLKEINEGQGIKIEKMYDLSEEQAGDTDYIMNKTLEIKALVELSQEILSKTDDTPIVKSWLESEATVIPAPAPYLSEASDTGEAGIQSTGPETPELEVPETESEEPIVQNWME